MYCRNCGKQLTGEGADCPRCDRDPRAPRAVPREVEQFAVRRTLTPTRPDTGWTFPIVLYSVTVACGLAALYLVVTVTNQCTSGFFGETECGSDAMALNLMFVALPLSAVFAAVLAVLGIVGILPGRRALARRVQQAVVFAALGAVLIWFALGIAGG